MDFWKLWKKLVKGQMLDDPIMELKLMEDSYQQEMNSRAFSMSQTVDLYATLEGISFIFFHRNWQFLELVKISKIELNLYLKIKDVIND